MSQLFLERALTDFATSLLWVSKDAEELADCLETPYLRTGDEKLGDLRKVLLETSQHLKLLELYFRNSPIFDKGNAENEAA